MNSNIKILGSYWFTELGSSKPIGIVIAEVPYKGVVGYIGTSVGNSQVTDEEHIVSHGAKLHSVVLEDILDSLD